MADLAAWNDSDDDEPRRKKPHVDESALEREVFGEDESDAEDGEAAANKLENGHALGSSEQSREHEYGDGVDANNNDKSVAEGHQRLECNEEQLHTDGVENAVQ